MKCLVWIIALAPWGGGPLWYQDSKDEEVSNELHPSWSPDGKHLVFYSDVNGHNNLYTIEVATGKRRQITHTASDNGNPVWSPTGEYIAFHSDRDGNYDVFIVKPDGAGLQKLADEGFREMSPAWSPDGRSLLYEADFEGNWQTFRVHLESGESHQLTFNAQDHLAATFHPEGERIYYSRSSRGNHQSDVELQYFDLESKKHFPLTESSGVTSNIDFSKNSERVVFNSLRHGNWELYSMNLDGTNVKRLTNNTETLPTFEFSNIDGQPSFSPDGNKVAFLSGREGSFDICLIDLDGKNFRNITKGWRKNK